MIKVTKRCLVFGCGNWSDAGEFIGDLCSPCHNMITTGRIHPANMTFIGKRNSEIRQLKKYLTEIEDIIFKINSNLGADWVQKLADNLPNGRINAKE